jgi:uncharacterized membrane protein YfcA
VHAAILLWAAGIAHAIGGNVDYGLMGNILIGSVPGVIIGSQLSVKWPQGLLRGALGVILVAAGVTIMNKADTALVPWVVAVATIAVVALFAVQIALRKEVEQDPEEQAELEAEREREAEDRAAREPVLAAVKD